MKRELSVVIAADRNFSIPFGLAVLSLLETAAASTKYDIYALDDNIDEQVKDYIESLRSIYDFNITYFDVTETIKDVPASTWFPRVAFARYLIPQLLSAKERVLYIDADVLFREDLTPLFDTDLENKPVGAVPDLQLAAINNRSYIHMLERKYGVKFYKNNHIYFNSGVLLFDCKLWNTGGYTKKIFDYCKKDIPQKVTLYDQDFLNLACQNYIKRIPTKYGCVPFWENYYLNDYKENFGDISSFFVTPQELKESYNAPAIIHYAGKKPIVFREASNIHEQYFFDFLKKTHWKNRVPYFPKEILRFKAKGICFTQINNPNLFPEQIITVILYTYNNIKSGTADALIQSITSICTQSYPHIEIMIVDNNSDDGTLDLLEKYKEFGILTYISQASSMHEAYEYAFHHTHGRQVQFMEIGNTITDCHIYEKAIKWAHKTQPALIDRNKLSKALSLESLNCNTCALLSSITTENFYPSLSEINERYISLNKKLRDTILIFNYRRIRIKYYRALAKRIFMFGENRLKQKTKIKQLRKLLKETKNAIKENTIGSLLS